MINTKIFNRPLTPHLTIYTSQITSLYSIWHRLSGVILTFFSYFFLLYLKIFNLLFGNILFNELTLVFQNIFIINIILIFFYHFFNGFRHISWDLGFNLHLNNLKKTAFITIIFLFIIGFYRVLNILI